MRRKASWDDVVAVWCSGAGDVQFRFQVGMLQARILRLLVALIELQRCWRFLASELGWFLGCYMFWRRLLMWCGVTGASVGQAYLLARRVDH